jgi:hypothetical protein
MDDLDLAIDLDDYVLFELPTMEDAEAFEDRLRPRWGGWSVADDDIWLVSADVGGAPGDLPQLFEEAQQLLAELGLPDARFFLDGRVYWLPTKAEAPLVFSSAESDQAA